ncbi:MAG: sodium:solute symporter [Gammaproteobacteria bacterium]|jgi:SSS family solute:Na+ symporter
MPEFQLQALDLAMVGAYVVFIVALGFYLARRIGTTDDYFLAGRSLSWWLIGLSLFASNVSSSTFVGLSSAAYSSGIAVYNYEWMAALVLIIFLVFFLPFYLRTRVYTLPEFLEKRFDHRARRYFAALQIVMNIAIDAAAALYAGALVVQILYPEIPLWQSVLVLGALGGLYTVAGGLKAVVYTDAVQAALLLLGACLVGALSFRAVGADWSLVTQSVPAADLSIVLPASDPVLPWPGLVTGVFLLGFYFWCTNQFMVQRALGAKNLDHGRYGALLAGLLKLPIIFIVVLPGIFGRLLYPANEFPVLAQNADLIFPTLMFDLLPVGIRGLIVAALLAAIMSSLDSILNAASTLVTMDFVRVLRPNISNHMLVVIGRVVTFVFMTLAILWAPQIVHFPNIWTYLQQMLAYLAPPVVACFVLGVFWKRASAQGAIAALIVGHLAAALIFALALAEIVIVQSEPLTATELRRVAEGAPVLHFLYVAPIVFIVSLATLIGISLLSRAPDRAHTHDLTWSPHYFAEETRALRNVPFYKNYRYLAGMLMAAIAVSVISWW